MFLQICRMILQIYIFKIKIKFKVRIKINININIKIKIKVIVKECIVKVKKEIDHTEISKRLHLDKSGGHHTMFCLKQNKFYLKRFFQ